MSAHFSALALTQLAELSLEALRAAAAAVHAAAVAAAVGYLALVVSQAALATFPLWLAVAGALAVLAVARAQQGAHHCRAGSAPRS